MNAISEAATLDRVGVEEPRGGSSPPRSLADLREEIVALVEEDRRQRRVQEGLREREQAELAALRAMFERTVAAWMERAEPRLRLLLDLLPSPGSIERAATGCRITAAFPPTPDFPVAASLSIEIVPVDRYRTARVVIEPLLIPMLQGHPEATMREFGLADADPAEIDRHVDRGVVAFARSYLHVRDPDSPYQACRRST